MTIQQEAYMLIDTLPEDSVEIIIQLMHRLGAVQKKERKEFSFSDYVTPTERADNAQEYVRELRDNDRV
jgi:hypothetical protein